MFGLHIYYFFWRLRELVGACCRSSSHMTHVAVPIWAITYRALTIDTETCLYSQRDMLPYTGLVSTDRPGVISVDGHHQSSPQSLSHDEGADAVLSTLGLPPEADRPITKCWTTADKQHVNVLQGLSPAPTTFPDSWTRGQLDEFSEYSVRYTDGGRCIIVAAGQTVVKIRKSGDSLTAEIFEDCARRLLEHTIRRDGPTLTAPTIKRGPLLSMAAGNHDEHPSKLLVHSDDGRFSLYFELDKPVAAANATTEGCAYMFDKYVQEITADCVIVELKMLDRSYPGSHMVKVHFADSDTMVSISQTVETEVVE
ncbi:hypothetical protein EDD18DRAFT_1330809 [Armillaria luteobubalina]|uniref:Uncharacterized protein n=1 Tax=Armillaria luteobubalina TaxID=153913 RepID=A0AA39Q7D2_9AGAR|nr:hypothetical protein EDD18DRAFT_1330809 [Armillaria luteobubalina]